MIACAAASESERPANRTATVIQVLHRKRCLGLLCRTVMMMGRQGAAYACCTCCRTPRQSTSWWSSPGGESPCQTLNT